MGQVYYFASIEEFKNAKTDAVLGQLLINDRFSTIDCQKNAWRSEINILQTQLSFLAEVILLSSIPFQELVIELILFL